MNLLRISFVFLICVILIGLVESRPWPRPWNLKKKLAKVGQKIKSGVKKVGEVVKKVGHNIAQGTQKVGENLKKVGEKVKQVVAKASKGAVKEIKKRCPVLKRAEENNPKIRDIIKKAGGVVQIAKIAEGIKDKKKAQVIISTAVSILKLLKDHKCSS